MEDQRRQTEAWKEILAQGSKLRVMLKGALTPPAAPMEVDGVTRFTPTHVDVWVCLTDYDTELDDSEQFRQQIVTDQVLTVAVYDPTMPGQVAPTGKTGVYGQVELIDGILELTWIGC